MRFINNMEQTATAENIAIFFTCTVFLIYNKYKARAGQRKQCYKEYSFQMVLQKYLEF
jgi:hypothetical protein